MIFSQFQPDINFERDNSVEAISGEIESISSKNLVIVSDIFSLHKILLHITIALDQLVIVLAGVAILI